MDVLHQMSHGGISRYLLTLGPDIEPLIPREPTSKTKRLNALMAIIDGHRERRLPTNEYLQDDIVLKAIEMLPRPTEWHDQPDLNVVEAAFVRALELDGYTWANGELRRALPEVVDVSEAETDLVALLEKYGMQRSEGHLRQALTAHTNGDWASANAQIRTFFDSLFDEMSVQIDADNGSLSSGHAQRAKLASYGLFSHGLNEWTNDGKGYMNGLARRLHPEGSHPGLSNAEDSTFRLQIVLITARYFLVRYDGGRGS